MQKIPEDMGDNFLIHVTEKPTKRGALLDLVLTNNKCFVGDVKVKGSDHKVVEFRLRKGRSKAKCEITTLGFSRADFAHFMDLLESKPWDKGPDRRRI